MTQQEFQDKMKVIHEFIVELNNGYGMDVIMYAKHKADAAALCVSDSDPMVLVINLLKEIGDYHGYEMPQELQDLLSMINKRMQ